VDIVIRVLPVTSTSFSIVSWGLFCFLYDALGSVCTVSSSLLGVASSTVGIVERVFVSGVINFRLGTVIIPLLPCASVVGFAQK